MFGKLRANLLLLIIFSSICYADTRTDQPSLLIGDINGTNAGRYRSLQFSNGSTTNNNDGSITVTTGGSGSNPSSPTNSIQYNNGGSFGGNSGLLFVAPNVGINSATPGQILDVKGTIRTTGFTLTTSPTSGYVLTTDSNGNGSWVASSGGGSGTVTSVTLATPNSSLTLGGTNPITTSGTINADINLSNSNTWTGQQLFNTVNVGINSATPGQRLDVSGTVRATNLVKNGGTSSQFLKADGSVDSSTYLTANQTITLTGDVTGSGNGSFATTLKNTGSAGTYRSTTFDAQGRETSGTNPTTFSGYAVSDTSANLATALTDEVGTGFAVFNGSPNFTGNVGISSLTPGSTLDVNGTVRILGTGSGLNIGTAVPGNYLEVEGTLSPVVFFGISAGSTGKNVGIGTFTPGQMLDVAGAGRFLGTGNTTLNITSGNVGIATLNPGQLLDVFGNVRVSSVGSSVAVVSGSNACRGQATLSSGVVTVSTTCTPSDSSQIFLTDAQTSLTNVGSVSIATVTAGTSFVVQSTNVLDSSKANWWVVKNS